MKSFSGHQRAVFRSSTFVCLALGGGVLLFAGCHKKSEPANLALVQTAPADATPVQAAPSAVSLAAPAAAAPAVEVPAPDLSALTQALHIYTFQHKRMPKTFAELVAAGYVKNLPPLPPGKKFEISPTASQIIMVNQ